MSCVLDSGVSLPLAFLVAFLKAIVITVNKGLQQLLGA